MTCSYTVTTSSGAVFPTGMFNCYNNYACMTCSHTVTTSSGAVFPTGMLNCYNNYTSITMKPYIKGQYYMIITISVYDNYFLVVII